MSRLDKWSEEGRYPAFLALSETEEAKAFEAHVYRHATHEPDATPPPLYEMITLAKELVFETTTTGVKFTAIIPLVHLDTLEVSVGPVFEIILDDNNPERLSESVRRILAYALTLSLPVVPNEPSMAESLAVFHRDLVAKGFTVREPGTGEEKRLVLAKKRSDVATLEHFKNLDLSEMHSAAEIALMRDAVLAELTRREEATRILTELRVAIDELRSQLTSSTRNEASLQRALTEHPMLFGPDYVRVLPKHVLGKEYEMDYGLERISGLVDLAEIEASSLPLFTQQGNPSHYLVHAEQQVLDWLHWIERHHEYAREELPGILRPFGYVIIGTNATLSAGDRRRLKQRNAVFRGVLQIMTYDDLLRQAETLLAVFEGRTKQLATGGDA